VDALIEKLKALAGDAWSDGWAEKVKAIADKAVADAVKSAVDGEKAKRLAAKKEASEAKTRIAELTTQLEAAGAGEESLAEALKAAGEAQAEAAALRGKIRTRDIAEAATRALTATELEGGAKIPAERMGSALKLLDLSGVDLDESGAVVGLESRIEALKSDSGFLWKAPESKGSGNGGKRQGADPPPKGKSQEDDPESPAALGATLAKQAFANRGGRRPEVRSHGS